VLPDAGVELPPPQPEPSNATAKHSPVSIVRNDFSL
jgi:hypothetical protein